MAKDKYYCVECWRFPADALQLPAAERTRIFEALAKSSDGPFSPDDLASKAPIGLDEELLVCVILGTVLGGPFLWIGIGLWLLLVAGTWTQCALFAVAHLVLAFHPLPNSNWLSTSRLSLSFYRYFSYRFVWRGNARAEVKSCGAWIGASPPHGAMPFANILCMPSINMATRPFVGCPATVVFYTPFLRYLLLAGKSAPVSKGGINDTVARGECVGLVPDGIAGIFKCSETSESVYLKERKGLAKLSLQTGTPLVPAYSFGNTDCFTCLYDSYGVLERLSRKAQASVFVFYGRWGLIIPRRINISMMFARPLVPPAGNPDVSQAEIDALHGKLLRAIAEGFDEWKAPLGYGHKQIKFV